MLSSTYPVARICQVLGVAKSRFYYQAARRDEADLRAALLRLAEQWPSYGRPRLTQMLKREGFLVGQRRVAGLMQELGLMGKRAARKPRTTNSQHGFVRFENLTEGLVIEAPDQVWVADITYMRRLRSLDCQISMAVQGDPRQNGYAERLVRTIKEEHIALSEYADFEDACSQIGRFLDEVYMHKRIHPSLGYLTPVEFESQWRKEQADALALQD